MGTLKGEIFISPYKIRNYLLKFRKKSDKSKFLNSWGYYQENWDDLLKDIFDLCIKKRADFKAKNEYGEEYIVKGTLPGKPGFKSLRVYTVWYYLKDANASRFITLRPLKKEEEIL